MRKHRIKDVLKGFRLRAFFLKILTPKLNRFTVKMLQILQIINIFKFLPIKGVHKEVVHLMRKNQTKLRLVIYRPKLMKESAKALLWLYSGGYLFGSPESERPFIKTMMKTKEVVMFLPHYIKSTKAPYPYALEDAILAFKYMVTHKHDYGVKTNETSIGGASAGGGLSQALAQYNLDKIGYPIRCALSIYPMLDIRENHALNTYVWNSQMNRYAWKVYQGKNPVNGQYLSSSTRINLTGLPKLITYIGTLDLFHNETLAYIKNLKNSNVDVSYQVYEGCYHGFDMVKPNHAISKKAHAWLAQTFLDSYK